MGQMQIALERILHCKGGPPPRTLPLIRRDDLIRTGYVPQINKGYRALGGVLPVFEFRMSRWDLEYEGIAIELDEWLHFNRYRGVTLRSPLYRELPSFPLKLYRKLCRRHEDACLNAGGYGGKWSNKSCERQFGPGGRPGDVDGGNAPRWKQRAFYDFLKDLAPLVVGIKVVRIAIYDLLSIGSRTRTVEEVLLEGCTPLAKGSIEGLIRERIA